MQEYAVSFQLHGDGIPFLIEYEDMNAHFCYVVMRSDISESDKFIGVLEPKRYFDYETPYGYGGPLCDTIIPEHSQSSFLSEMTDFAQEEGIVSQFVRFHPLLSNHKSASNVFETRYMHDVIYMDTSSPELIMKNMDSKNRNMVRKAIKNEVTIVRKPIDQYKEFLSMYEETMLKDNADAYYTFHEDYFQAQQTLNDYACFFYAVKDGQPIAGAIMYYNDRFIHYHLAGTHTEYRKFSPSNLLLYEVACWASERGIKRFHLGGGMKQDDSLFGFKKQFNKNGRLPFVIGRTVFNQEIYQYLLQVRKKCDSDFNAENGRMIQYRA